MKINYVLLFNISIIIVAIIISVNVIKTYSIKDVNRVLDIYLGRTEPTILDYNRLDINNDKVIDLLDGVLILNDIGE